ncbi:MAG: hypothetical protein ACRD2B_00145 [Terriglobia bacterium]
MRVGYPVLSIIILSLLVVGLCGAAELELPGGYFPLLVAGSAQVKEALDAEATPSLQQLETRPSWHHFPYAILAPAVLYVRKDPANLHYHDPAMLKLALRIGDLLASEDEKGRFEPRLDSDWDTYMWLEAYRILQPQLGAARRARWRRAIERNTALLVGGARARLGFPWYESPYLGTSPNHYVQWAELIYLAGRVFGKPGWVRLGTQILHRFATVEISPDGFWGEHEHDLPTPGYDYLTLDAVGVYWEHSKDPAARAAIRKDLTFHENFTYPDGKPVEVIDDRNRYWEVSPYGHFAFSLFPDGRRYAAFLTGFFSPNELSMVDLGRLAQDALYFHAGPTAPIPDDRANYAARLSVPAGIRKMGDWVVCLSGLIATRSVTNQYSLDRQANFSVFNRKVGLIIPGANSKDEPPLATFFEKLRNQTFYMPINSRLQIGGDHDRLSLAYNTFFSDLYVARPAGNSLKFTFDLTSHGRPAEEAALNLQLCLKAGETLVTGAGKRIVLGSGHVDLSPAEIGGWIRQNGWTLKVDPTASLVWPVYPYNPYANGPERTLQHAVGRLWVPVRLAAKDANDPHLRKQKIAFSLSVGE